MLFFLHLGWSFHTVNYCLVFSNLIMLCIHHLLQYLTFKSIHCLKCNWLILFQQNTYMRLLYLHLSHSLFLVLLALQTGNIFLCFLVLYLGVSNQVLMKPLCPSVLHCVLHVLVCFTLKTFNSHWLFNI